MSAESLPTDKLIGQVLANRYQMLHRLGEGAMGVVYKARHVKVGRSFAVKVLHSHLLQDGKVALRFDREAELAGRLRHANVIGVVDVGEVDGMRYMVMDFAEGPDLAQLLVEAPMPAERIIHIVRQLLEGLYHAHGQGLIHRDFKPENVIIERDAHGAELPRIVDFGIAILRDGSESTNGQDRLTTNGLVLGTPHYMAPEQAVADPIDHRIDLFALGIVIYEMLSGRLPFDGSGAEVARANLLVDPPAIAERVPYLEVDPLLEAFARRLMSKKPSDRPPTAKAARELLDLIDRDRPAAAAALGMPALGERGPAVTQSVAPQARNSAPGDLSPPQTTRLRATPSPSQPVEPPGRDAPPSSQAATTSIPAAAPHLPPGPIAFSAPHSPVPLAAGQPPGDHETAIQTPLGWPVTTTKRRTPLVVAGVGVGLAVILAGLLITRSGAPPDQPAVADRGTMTPTGVNPTASGTPASPTATAPKAAEPAPANVEPIAPKAAEPAAAEPAATEPKATEPKATEPKATEPTPLRPVTKRPVTHEPRTKEPKAAEAAAIVPTPPPPSAVEDKPRDARPAETKAVAPQVPAPKAHEAGARPEVKTNVNAGITPQAVAALYSATLAKINQLPSDASQDLMTRWRRYNVQGLMLAPQAERDQAAEQLSKLRDEAVERLSKSRKEK
jgi:serine/threonine protein kinase